MNSTFNELELKPNLITVLNKVGYETPIPIKAQTIKTGRDK